MIKRISTIKNIGPYRNCNGRRVQFDKITLVYGRNTYGKSTLGDILSSLQSANDPDLLTTRKTIPNDSNPQKVEIRFENPAGGSELKALFNGNVWQNQLANQYLLSIYDDEFYHQNVFLGRELTRSTKENFSDFILGSQGVVKAQLIEDKNKEKGEKKKLCKQLEEGVFSKIGDLAEFLTMPIVEDIDITRENLTQSKQDHAALIRQQKESESIKGRKNLFPIRVENSFSEAVNTINSVFEEEIKNPHQSAKLELIKHIEENFKKPNGAEQWIMQGLAFIDKDNCSFCGQELSSDANELLDLYRQCFDDQYTRHDNYIKSIIEKHKPELHVRWLDELLNTINKDELLIQTYPELTIEKTSKDLIDYILKIQTTIKDIIPQAKQHAQDLVEKFNPSITLKTAFPQNKLPLIYTSDFAKFEKELSVNIKELCSKYIEFNKLANKFKSQFEEDKIVQNLQKFKESSESLDLQVKRFEKNVQCEQYQNLKSEIAVFDTDIPLLREQLESEQANYLTLFFSNINRHFKDLGSRDFTLELKTETRGHRPVNSFVVKFKGQEIADKDLAKVFSESDRRSLGLSIFFASFDALDSDELAKTIVILDDPVTSFDENRVGQTHSKLVKLIDSCKQIILLSHFKEGIANFIKVHDFSRDDIKLVEINKNSNGSELKNGDPAAFIKSTHDLQTDELIDFVERNTDKLSCKPRVYLEEILKIRFCKQIRDKSITNENLSNRIDALNDEDIISQEIANSLHEWRNELNPEHHIWLGDDVENQRTTIAKFLDFVFYDLNPEPISC